MEISEFISRIVADRDFQPVGEDLKKWQNAKWSNLNDCLTCLDIILKNALVEIIVKTRGGPHKMICTSNYAFIGNITGILSGKDQKNKANFNKNTFGVKPGPCVITWDFLRMRYAHVTTMDFMITGFIEISRKNADLISEMAKQLLSPVQRHDNQKRL